MRLTSFTDFGLRVLMRLAGAPEQSFSTDALAQEFGVSRHHLKKVVRQLAEAGYVVTRRGAHGGFRLARSAASIPIGEVVQLLENRQALVECFQPDGGACVLTPRCRLKSKLGRAREAFLADLNKTTLADIAYRPARKRA